MTEARQRQIVRFRTAQAYEAARKRIRTFDQLNHSGWDDPNHLFLVMDVLEVGVLLCPIASDDSISPNAFEIPSLGIGEGNIITHVTWLHTDLALLARDDEVDQACHPKLSTLKGEIQGVDFTNRLKKSFDDYFKSNYDHLPPPD
ncbi:MAG: hypothetical protein KDB82_14910 [Planctomycetes bacterium]|nr:hypothetical protein [Planctomycetota bacterium]